MKVSKFQFFTFSLLTVCAILWLLLLTCYREYWGFWQSPETYSFLKNEYPQWFRDYIVGYHGATLWFTALVYCGWLCLCCQRIADSRSAQVLLVGMTLLFGLTIGVLCANNIINFLDSGQLHGRTHLQDRY